MATTLNSTAKKRKYHYSWHLYHKSLVDRGDFSISFEIFDSWKAELDIQNTRKKGKKFKYPDCLFAVCAILRYQFSLPFRQLSGFIRHIIEQYGFEVPHYDTIRRRILSVKLEEYLDCLDFSDKEISIAIDSSGLKIIPYGEWLRKKHGSVNKTRKGWIKIHVATEVNSHTVIAVEITDESESDSSKGIPLIKGAEQKCKKVFEVLGDGGYDSREIFNYCHKNSIDPIIRIRKNSSTKARGSPARAALARVVQNYGLKIWKKLKRFGRRWAVERAYSVFKHVFGEYVLNRNYLNQCLEIRQKVMILNHWMNQLSLIKV